MAQVPIRGVGTKGLNADTPSVLLDQQTWSDGINIRFDNGAVEKMPGHAAIETTTVDPDFLQYWPRPNTQYYVYGNSTDLYRVGQDGTSESIGTGFDPLGKWHTNLFNGGFTVLFNNTLETPQFITYEQDDSDTAVAEIPGWNYGGLTVTAEVLRSFGSVLVAGNFRISTPGVDINDPSVVTEFPSTVRVSTRAAPGQVPTTFEPGVLGDSDSADEFELATPDRIVEIAEISRGKAIIYTANSFWDLSVGASASQVNLLSNTYGCRNINCVTSFENQHFVVGQNDVYTHSGSSSIKSVIDGRFRDYLFNNLHPLFFDNIFTQLNGQQDEIWICFPNLASSCVDGRCNEALIWNYRQDTWTKRELPSILDATQGPIPGGGIPSYRFVADGETTYTAELDNNGDAIGLVGAGQPETFDAVVEVQSVTLDADTALRTDTDAIAEVQVSVPSGSHSNIRIGEVDTQDSVILTVRGDFESGADTTWSFDPDTTTTTPMAVDVAVSAADLGADAFLTEVGAAIEALGDGSTFAVVENTMGDFDIRTVAEEPIDISFDLTVNTVPGEPVTFFPNTLMDQSIETARVPSPITYGTTIDTTKALFIGKRIDGPGDFWWADNAPRPDGTVPDRLPGINSRVNPVSGEDIGFNSFGDGEYTIDDTGVNTGGTFNGNGAEYYSLKLSAQPNFMDIVHYSGTGVTQQVAHDLDEAPAVMLVKDTMNATNDWRLFHEDLQPRRADSFNENSAFVIDTTSWNDTAPNATTFTVGTSQLTNGTGNDYVAYLFANNPDGNVICDTYTVTAGETFGKVGGFFVPLPWEPEVIWVKNASNAVGWTMFSSIFATRDTDFDKDYVSMNDNAAVVTGNQLIRIQGKGFRLITQSLLTGLLDAASMNFTYIAMRSARPEDGAYGGTFYDGDYGLTPPVVPGSQRSATSSTILGDRVRETAANSGTRTLGTGQNLRGDVVADNAANEVVFGANADTSGGSGTGFVGGTGAAHVWTVPAGVTSVSMVAVGGGGGGFIAANASGGGGGALSYRNNVPVTPGEVLEITVGRGGIWTAAGSYEFASASTVVRDTGNLTILQANFGVRGNADGMNQRTASGRDGGLPTDFSATNYTAYNTAASPLTADYASNLGGFGGSGNNNSASAGGGGGAAGYLGEGARDGFAGGSVDTMTFTNGVNAGGGAGTGSQASFRAGGGGGGTGTQGFSSRRRSTANGITQYGGGGARYSQTSSQNSGGQFSSWSWPGEGYAGGTDGDVSWNADGSNSSRRNKGGNGGFPGGGGGGSLSFDNLQFGTAVIYPVNNVDPFGNGGFGQVRIIWGNQSDGATPRQFPDGECETISYEDPKTMSMFIPWQDPSTATSATIWDTERGNLNYLNIGEVSNSQITRGLGMREWGTEGPVIGRGTTGNSSVSERRDFNINALWPTPTNTWDGFANLNFVEGDTFDVVQYAGDGTSGQVIPHNLGANVSFIWIKNITATEIWTVLHRDVDTKVWDWGSNRGVTNNGFISIDAAGEVTVNADGRVGGIGEEYIAYLFADVPDQGSATGTFTGIAAVDQVIDLGFKPDMFMIKAENVAGFTGHWWLFFRDASVDAGASPAYRMVGGQAPTFLQPTNGNVQFNGNTIRLNGNVSGVNFEQEQSIWFAVGKGSSPDEAERTTGLASPDFAVYDENGVLVEMTDTAALMALGAGGAANAAIFAAGVNALETGTANWTATATDNSVQLVTDIYASDMNSDAVATTTATGLENVVDGTDVFDPALVSGEFFSGSPGSASIEVALGTSEDVTTTFSVNRGTGRNTLPESVDDEHVFDDSSGTNSQYTVRDPSGAQTGMVISSSTTDVESSDLGAVVDAIETFINNSIDMPRDFNAVRDGDDLILTADTGGASAGLWSITAVHNNIDGQADGNISFTVTETVAGTDPEPLDAQPSVSFAGPTSTSRIIFPSRGLDTPMTGAEVAAVIRSDLSVGGWSLSGTGSDVVFTADVAGVKTGLFNPNDITLGTHPFADDVFSDDNFSVLELIEGLDELTQGEATIIVGRVGDVGLDDPDSDVFPYKRTFTYSNGELPLVIITDLHTWFETTLFCEFDTEVLQDDLEDDTLSATANAFSTTLADFRAAGEVFVDIVQQGSIAYKTAGQLQPPVGQLLDAPFTLLNVLDTEVFDRLRPWRTDEYNLSRTFLVMAGSMTSNLFAADVSNQFDGVDFTAFVERRGNDFGDLESTKWVESVYPLVDGTGTVDVKVNATDAYGAEVDFNSRDTYSSVFDIANDYKEDAHINGRFINYRFESTDEAQWRLAGLTFLTTDGDKR